MGASTGDSGISMDDLQGLGDSNTLAPAMQLQNQAVSPTVAGATPAWAAPASAMLGGLSKGLTGMQPASRGGGGGMMATPQQPQLPAALTQGNNSFLTQALQQLNPNGQLNANLLYGG